MSRKNCDDSAVKLLELLAFDNDKNNKREAHVNSIRNSFKYMMLSLLIVYTVYRYRKYKIKMSKNLKKHIFVLVTA